MSCSADYYLVTLSQRRLLCADVCSAQAIVGTTKTENAPLLRSLEQYRVLHRCCELVAPSSTTVTHSQRRIVGTANVGSTDQAVLNDVITHDKLFQHILVGATRTSAPNSRCYQCLQKNIFAHFLWFGWGRTKEQSALQEIRSTYYYLLQILFFCALLAER